VRVLGAALVFALALASTACGPAGPAGPAAATPAPGAGAAWFVESARAAGLDFTFRSGHRERYLMPEIMAGGAALFDADGDGDLDAYLVQAGEVEGDPAARPPNQLFRNRGDGTFDDITAESGAGDRGYGFGVTAGDYDNDGRTDLYVTNLGPNTLLRNLGGGKFAAVPGAGGAAGDDWSASAAFLDYERDGDLDLFVANYLAWSLAIERPCVNESGAPDYCSPKSYGAPAPDRLYRNDGDGTFADVSDEAGLGAAFGNGLGVAPGDFDGDGWVDVFVANDGTPNQLWVNNGDGTFTDQAPMLGVAVDENGKAKAGMGTDAADVDDDGDLDLLVVNRDAPAHLLKNVAAGRDPSRRHWIRLRVLDEHGRDALGARVTLTAGERTLTREVHSAFSYQSASDPRVHIGLGAPAAIGPVTVRWPDGATETFAAPAGVDREMTLRKGRP